MKPLIFIDGEAGTTGLEIRNRLAGRRDIEFLSLGEDDRKDEVRRSDALNSCDVAILCLPDDAARGAVSMIRNQRVRVLDASSAHRTTPGWTYGFPELSRQQADALRTASLVSNPGCYPTGVVAMIAPLVRSGLLPRDFAANVCATSGYSGAGKSLIQKYEDPSNPQYTTVPFSAYALQLEHKHIEEMRLHSGLNVRPIFLPAIGRYKQGILMQIPVHLDLIGSTCHAENFIDSLKEHYRDSKFVQVASLADGEGATSLTPEELNGSNNIVIRVFGSNVHRQLVLCAVYDNLGKGASGAAVQNLNIMLGLSEEGRLDLRVAA